MSLNSRVLNIVNDDLRLNVKKKILFIQKYGTEIFVYYFACFSVFSLFVSNKRQND